MDLMAHTGLMESMEAINILKTSRENIVEREDRTVKDWKWGEGNIFHNIPSEIIKRKRRSLR